MIVAIMQPYFFPYMGYFDLMRKCDLFVCFDDVQYIRRGWVNRNRIACKNQEFQFLTIPVKKASRESKINQMLIDHSTPWHQLHMRKIKHNYKKNCSLVEMYATLPRSDYLIEILERTIEMTRSALGISTPIIRSSEIACHDCGEIGPKKRIIEICKALGADTYLNLPGGRELYNSQDFTRHNIALEFIETDNRSKLSVLHELLK